MTRAMSQALFHQGLFPYSTTPLNYHNLKGKVLTIITTTSYKCDVKEWAMWSYVITTPLSFKS